MSGGWIGGDGYRLLFVARLGCVDGVLGIVSARLALRVRLPSSSVPSVEDSSISAVDVSVSAGSGPSLSVDACGDSVDGSSADVPYNDPGSSWCADVDVSWCTEDYAAVAV